jgi:ribonuclease HII
MTPKQRKARNAYERERRRLHRLHRFEYAARERGFTLVGGIDEVGRGPLAGPVVAACVVAEGPLLIKGLNDSKQVRPQMRTEIAEVIRARVTAWAVGSACVAEIDRLNIYWASILAMERAIAALRFAPQYLITDAVRIRSFAGPQEPLIHGDARCAVVAAASILAKVHRDALMVELDKEDSRYGFALHKGYSTAHHIEALRAHGPSIHHRANWARVRDAQLALGLQSLEALETFTEIEPNVPNDVAAAFG